jgi:hypothetical protein
MNGRTETQTQPGGNPGGRAARRFRFGGERGAPWYRRLALAGLLVLAVLFSFAAASASADEIHVTKNSFGGGELSVGATSGIALNTTTNNLYVGDTGNERVLSYSAAGAALGSLGTFAAPTFVAVDNSAGGGGDIYVVETGGAENVISKVTSAGSLVTGWGAAGHLAGLGEIAGIAVDGSGHLWVFNAEGKLQSYAAGFTSGEQPGTNCTLPEGAGGHRSGIAVDAAGQVYVTRSEGQMRVVSASCASLTNELGESVSPAVDPADQSVFFSRGELEHGQVVGGRIEVGESRIGQSVTPEGPSQGEGEGSARAGQSVISATGHEVFNVLWERGEIFAFGLENVEPPALEGPAVSQITGTSAKFTAHIDPHRPSGANPLPYVVRYEFRCTPGCPGGEGTEPGDATNHLVEFTATGLQAGTKYKVELIARNKGGEAIAPEESAPPLEFTTGSIAPSVGAISIVQVSESEALVEVTINPGGAQATYQFEYVTLAQYETSGFAGASTTPLAILPAGGETEVVAQAIAGLTPGVRYKVRAEASNAVEAGVFGPTAELKTQEPAALASGCANSALQLGAGAFLADCRAYEQATPVEKNGGSAAGIAGGFIQGSETGGGISYYSQAGFPGAVGAQDFGTFVANRGGSSWKTFGLLPPQALGESAAALGLTPNNRGAISQVIRGEKVIALVYRDLESDETRFIVPFRPLAGAERFGAYGYVGASTDGTKIFFEATLPVTEPPAKPPATETIEPNLYMWNSQTDQVVLVGRNAAGEPLPEGSIGGPYNWLGEDTTAGGVSRRYYTGAIHAVSNDGDRAVFTEVGTGQLFVRAGLNGGSPSTLHVSESHNPDEPVPYLTGAAFLEATPNGEFIFFKSGRKLTPDAGNGECECSWNLYRYQVSTEELVDLTPEAEDLESGFGPEVQGLVGASSDGKIAYFVARGQMAAGAGFNQESMYRFDSASTPMLKLVATLKKGSSDYRVWSPVTGGGLETKTGEASTNGESVVFGSVSALTGFDNQSPNCGAGCREFYRWSTATETPECLTCDATGALPIGPASLSTPLFNAVLRPVGDMAPGLPRNLSADGKRFFFQTPDPLSGRDTNANQGCAYQGEVYSCEDVYQWEAAGTGSCRAAVLAGGCVTLLSSGDSAEPSYFGDASREGEDAYIFTSSQLVPADRDRLYDIYDVAVNGGLASQWEEAAAPCTSAEACGGQSSQPGNGATAGSETFVGPGNQKAKPPKKQCHKSTKKCKAHKKKHEKKKHHGKKKATSGNRPANTRTKNLGGNK